MFSRIVCEMGKAEMSQYTGNVKVCVGVGPCRPEFTAKSLKYYYFVVSVYYFKNILGVEDMNTSLKKMRILLVWAETSLLHMSPSLFQHLAARWSVFTLTVLIYVVYLAVFPLGSLSFIYVSVVRHDWQSLMSTEWDRNTDGSKTFSDMNS